MAPVRLRSVASGLMMEKVRSIAIDFVLGSADGSCGLISVPPVHGKRCDDGRRIVGQVFSARNYDNFTNMNPL
jgi:hypothetical protein